MSEHVTESVTDSWPDDVTEGVAESVADSDPQPVPAPTLAPPTPAPPVTPQPLTPQPAAPQPPTVAGQDDFLPRLGLMAVVVLVCAGLLSLYVLGRPQMGGVQANAKAASVINVATDRPSGLRGNNIAGVASAPGPALPALPPPAQAPAQQAPAQQAPAVQPPAAKANIPPPPPAANIPQVSNPDPETANKLAAEGNLASQRQDYAKAIELFTQALQLNPAPIYYGLRGDVNWRAGKLDEALSDYNNAIAMEPGAPDGYYGRARVYRDKGDKANAIRDLQTFLELKPNDAGNAGIRQEAQEMMNQLR